ncbi:MAG: glycosyltransferase family 39 protein [Candidatus Yanofskybacteria bacterium]|nr:glycosyltransferase family 39 protein [Candidatus Yanofskybacteria bacterium]
MNWNLFSKSLLKNNYWLWLLVLLFIATRFFGLDQLYYQDEYRWVSQVYTAEFGEVDSPHPPVMQSLLSLGGKIVGYGNLRVVPFIFGVLNLILIYIVSLKLTGNKKIAYIASGLYIINVYSLIASLMLDIDGTVLPFLVLLAYYFYLKVFKDGQSKFILPLALVMMVGFFTKLSYALFAGALAVEYLWTLYDKGKLKYKIKRTVFLSGMFCIFVVVFYVLYGKTDPRFAEYVTGFKYFNFASRAYFELFLRMFKFFIWLSPLLFLPMVYGLFRKNFFTKYRLWYVYSLFNLLFYLVIFDFARLPIERYFMFIIAPAAIVSGHIVYSLFSGFNRKHFFLSILGFAVLLAFTLLIAYDVVPLNPKEAYVQKVKNLDFNFLIPMTGGSGPIGFYVSAQFVLWVWVAGFLWLLFNKKKIAIAFFIVFGVGYNVLLSGENLAGAFYGSVNDVTKKSVEYVVNSKEVGNSSVVTYYDAGVYYLKIADKYLGRFYTAPSRDYSSRLTSHRGHYMIVDFPAIDKNSLYWKLISRCELAQKFTDKYVDAYIFDCRSLPAK